MKIVHVVESFSGGVYDFIVDLINGLSSHQHTIIYGRRDNTPYKMYEDFSRSTAFYLWSSAQREIKVLYDLKALLELINILKGIGTFDVLHLHSSKAGFLGRLAARILGKQQCLIYTSHGVSFLRQDVSKPKKRIFVELERLGAKLGGMVVACSASEREQFLVNGIQATYINNGVDAKMIRQYLGHRKDGEKVLIGTSGRITHPKNPYLFNKIALEFLNCSNIGFVWIGDGELRKQLTSPNIQVTGWVSKPEVFKHLGDIHIYLSTSLWEGLSLSGLQAMVAGLPLILSNCVGNRDLIASGFNGFLFSEYSEAVRYINDLLADEKLRIKLGMNSLESSQIDFALAKTIREYELQYHQIKCGN